MKIRQAVLACGSGIESENATNEKDPINTWATYVIRCDPRRNRLWEYLHHTPSKGNNAAEYLTECKDGGHHLSRLGQHGNPKARKLRLSQTS